MSEVINKLFLAVWFIPLIVLGCATAPPNLPVSAGDIADNEVASSADRIYFPNYNLSIGRPPAEWETQKELGQGELVIWVNREAGSVIEIMVSKAVRNLSYHNIATEFNRITCNLVQQKSPTVTCVIVDEKEMEFNTHRFYRVSIIYQGVSYDISVKSLVFIYRSNSFVYHFLFMEEKYSVLAEKMMQSVIFRDDLPKGQLPEKKVERLSIVDASYYGETATVENLLHKGVDINARNEDGVTALAYAADRGHMDIVKILLSHSAEINARSKIGSTPLMNAAYMGHVKIVEMLVENGADVNAQSNDGTTALMNAAARGYREIVEILLARDANVDACERCGLSALWNAISSDHVDIVKLLIDNGADVNLKANDGTTCLMNAAFTGNIDIVKMLLAAGAEVNAKADNGCTALMLAKRRGQAEIVRMLVQAGAIEDSPKEPGLNFTG